MALSDNLANKVLDLILGAVAYTPETNVKIALFNVTPALDGTGGTEVSGSGYAEITKANNLTNFPAATGRTKSNGAAITFPAATASWGTVVAVVVFANDGTTMLLVGELTTPKVVAVDDVVSFAVGQLSFTVVSS